MFLTSANTQVRAMGAAGEQLRLVRAQPGYSFAALAWSPDGGRIAYLKRNLTSNEYAIETHDLNTGITRVILTDPGLRSLCWARDWRIVYARLEPLPSETSSNLWEIETDPATGAVQREARRLTNWGGFLFSYLSLSADGKRLAFVSWRHQSDVFIGELEGNGGGLAALRRLTSDRRVNWPTGWSGDRRGVLFSSDRNATLDIFRQGLSDRDAKAVVSGSEEKRGPRLSPDGAWLLYMAWPNAEGRIRTGEGYLMRVAASGGRPQAVFSIAVYRSPNHSDARLAAFPEGYPQFRCPSVPQAFCVLAEPVQSQLVFTRFDPIAGRQGEVFRIDTQPSSVVFWDLSPDGRWIAFGTEEASTGRVRVVSLAGQLTREISLERWRRLEAVAWSADGGSLFLTHSSSKGGTLLRASLDGHVRPLHRAAWWLLSPTPSPDGRYLAFTELTLDSNAWVIENFR